MKVLIGTKNPGKIEGAKKAFEHYFDNVEVIGIKAESNVSDQPVGKETYLGAKNRVNNLIKYAQENNEKMKIAIVGYGNLGRGVELAVNNAPDLDLKAVFTRRDPATVKILTETAQVCRVAEAAEWKAFVS